VFVTFIPTQVAKPSITVFNMTNHFNPKAFHGNVADPAVLPTGEGGHLITTLA
jgi:hypothetical protein